MRWSLNFISVLALLLIPGGLAEAADLIEPWEPGVSNLEFFLLRTGPGQETAATALLGGGLGGGVSLGAALQTQTDSRARAMLTGFVTRSLGRGAELDLFAELGRQTVSGPEGPERRVDWMLGSEWSLPVGRVVPYTRWALASRQARTVHALAGVLLPLRGDLELHVELEAVVSGAARGPERLSVGPNLRLSPTVELLPEVSVLQDPGAGERHWAVMIGLVMDPRRLARPGR